MGAYEINGIFLVVFIYWQLFYAVKKKDTSHIVYVVAPILLMFIFIYTTLLISSPLSTYRDCCYCIYVAYCSWF
ncbi:hypothetical protein LR68_03432 [Anoxybacillus sp. BCO1]|nr:hypothetical protein LR68_03432 [Anoxybacillus sp. BCO1]